MLADPTTQFSIGDEVLTLEKLTVEQAELVAAQYPGRYVEVNEVKPKPAIDATK